MPLGVNHTNRQQGGQTLVLFAILIPTILAMMALVVDVGMMFVARRHMQNVADQAALVGAQSLPDNVLAEKDARRNAQANGVVESGLTEFAELEVYSPPKTGHYIDDPNYIEVVARQEVPIFFSGVYSALGGGTQTPSRIAARAVARGMTGVGYGAIIALRPDKAGIKMMGNAEIEITGGMWANNDLDLQAANATISGSITVVQDCDDYQHEGAICDHVSNNGGIIIQDPLRLIEPPDRTKLGYGACGDADESGWRVCTPGIYDGTNGSTDNIDVTGKTKFLPGIYWVAKGVKITGTAVSVMSEDQVVDAEFLENEEAWGAVSFYLDGRPGQPNNSTFSIEGNETVRFKSSELYYKNILIWKEGKTPWTVDDGNPEGKIIIGGTTNVKLVGTIYAPEAVVQIDGTSEAGYIKGQVIGYEIRVTGTNATNIQYDKDTSAAWLAPRLVE